MRENLSIFNVYQHIVSTVWFVNSEFYFEKLIFYWNVYVAWFFFCLFCFDLSLFTFKYFIEFNFCCWFEQDILKYMLIKWRLTIFLDCAKRNGEQSICSGSIRRKWVIFGNPNEIISKWLKVHSLRSIWLEKNHQNHWRNKTPMTKYF